jgi:hypothetical protein
MATRKKKAKRAPRTGVVARRARGAMRAIEAELPTNLRAYVRKLELRLGRLEGRLEQAGVDAQKQAVKLINDSRKQLAKLTAAATKEAESRLEQIEDLLAPATKAAKKVANRARRAAKKVTKRATKAAKKPVRKGKAPARKPARRRRKKKA